MYFAAFTGFNNNRFLSRECNVFWIFLHPHSFFSPPLVTSHYFSFFLFFLSFVFTHVRSYSSHNLRTVAAGLLKNDTEKGGGWNSNVTQPLLQHSEIYQHTHTHTCFSLKYGYAVTGQTGMMKKGLVPIEKLENWRQCCLRAQGRGSCTN